MVSKDVASCPAFGDELSFQINRDGSVEFSKNGNLPSVFMHVNISLPLWAFWDVYGHTSKIRLIGATSEPITRGDSDYRPQQFCNLQFEQHQPLSECTICFEKGNYLLFLHKTIQSTKLLFTIAQKFDMLNITCTIFLANF